MRTVVASSGDPLVPVVALVGAQAGRGCPVSVVVSFASDDLAAVLDAADQDAPAVLVGASLGAPIRRRTCGPDASCAPICTVRLAQKCGISCARSATGSATVTGRSDPNSLTLAEHASLSSSLSCHRSSGSTA